MQYKLRFQQLLSHTQQFLERYDRKWLIAVACLLGSLLIFIVWPSTNEYKWTFISQFGIKLPLKYEIHGIDVSHHNAHIDWDKLKQASADDVKVDFVFIKATEGATHIDKKFDYNWREADRVGIKKGAYHFYNPRRLSAEQAQNFIRKVKLKSGDLPPVLDLEVSAGRSDDIIIKGVKNWLEIVGEHYGVKPIIYVNEHYYKRYIKGNFDDYPLWIAGYSRTHMDDIAESDKILFWQHSEKGWIDGIKGFVDFNVFIHSSSKWKDLGV